MKKLMMLLASTTFAITSVGSVVACNTTSPKEETGNKIIPTVSEIKKMLKKQNYDVDSLDVDLQPGMKTAIIRYMPDTINPPFLTKTIDLDWSTNDLTKIITLTSIPYSKNDLGAPYTTAKLLEVVNMLNGTNFSDDGSLKVTINSTTNNAVIEAVTTFSGKVNIINGEPLILNKIFTTTNLGNIYIKQELYDEWVANNSTIVNIAVAIMEFVGDRNRFAGLYKATMTQAFFNAATIGGVTLKIDENKVGSLTIKATVAGVIDESSFTVNFNIKTTPRIFLTINGVEPQDADVISISLEKSYTQNDLNQLRYDVVEKVLGKDFADKYQAVFYDEIWPTDFDVANKTVTLNPKPGSKIFAASDENASGFTKIPRYTLEITFK